MQPVIAKIDGTFGVDDLSNIQWSDYNSQALSQYQLLQINGNGLSNGYAVNRMLGGANYYNPTKNEWELDLSDKHYLTSTAGWNLVYLRNEQGEGGQYYICRDEEILNIPGITEQATFRTRIAENVTPYNYANYKHAKEEGISETVIPIAPISRLTLAGNPYIAYLSVFKTDAGMGLKLANFSNFTLDEHGYPFPSSKQYLQNAADKPIQDLETRVSLLEKQVSDLQVMVNNHDKILKDLPAIVSAVSANVSKNYVAR